MSDDKTKQLLEQILSNLYAHQGQQHPDYGPSYLIAQDGQFLGRITDNLYDQASLLNSYGPYGSTYSPTSIFNAYSPYGSPYGAYSMNNPYCGRPPKLFLNKQLRAHVTKNNYVQPAIAPEAFIFALKNALPQLLQGQLVASSAQVRQQRKESYIEAADGAFLGSLSTSPFDTNSIFNKFSPYGNQLSPTCIFNNFSAYGNHFSQLSPFNPFSHTPPKILIRGEFAAHLTKNENLRPRVDPNELERWVRERGL